MTRNLNKELKKYYRDISKALSGSKEKKAIIAQIKSSVGQYIQDNPDAAFADITQKFGFPTEIAEQYFDDDVAKHLSAQMNKRRKIGIAVAIIVFIVVAALTCVILHQSTSTVIREQTELIIGERIIKVIKFVSNINESKVLNI